MVIAWVGFASIGMFTARFMRSVWGHRRMCGKGMWYQVRAFPSLILSLLLQKLNNYIHILRNDNLSSANFHLMKKPSIKFIRKQNFLLSV